MKRLAIGLLAAALIGVSARAEQIMTVDYDWTTHEGIQAAKITQGGKITWKILLNFNVVFKDGSEGLSLNVNEAQKLLELCKEWQKSKKDGESSTGRVFEKRVRIFEKADLVYYLNKKSRDSDYWDEYFLILPTDTFFPSNAGYLPKNSLNMDMTEFQRFITAIEETLKKAQ